MLCLLFLPLTDVWLCLNSLRFLLSAHTHTNTVPVYTCTLAHTHTHRCATLWECTHTHYSLKYPAELYHGVYREYKGIIVLKSSNVFTV